MCDQRDLRKRHIHFGRRNTTAERAATRMLPTCRLSAGLVPVRLRQTSHTKILPKKAATVRPIEHLKQAGQLQCWAKGLPPNSPRERFNSIPYFLERGCWGVPRGRGEGGKPFACPLVLVATWTRGAFIFTTNILNSMHLAASAKRWPIQPPRPMFTVVSIFADEGCRALLPGFANLRKQAGHKAERYSVADAWSDWPDCAWIKACFASLRCCLRAC